MTRVLLICSVEKSLNTLVGLLRANPSFSVESVTSGSEGRRALTQSDYALVVINTPLSDEFGHELALTAAEDTSAGVLLLVKNENADQVAERVELSGVMVVPKPFSRAAIFQAARMLIAAHQKLSGLMTENQKLQKKIEEIRLVDRAKCLLIQHRGMGEEEAHHAIEKQAMDERKTRREVATMIIDCYQS